MYQYNKDFQTDANAEQYIHEYGKVELLSEKDGQVFLDIPIYTIILLQNILQIILVKTGRKGRYNVCRSIYTRKNMGI